MKIPFIPVLALGTMAFATWHLVHSQTPQRQTPSPIKPATSPFLQNVAGTGVVESRSENIAVASLVPGVVKSVSVREGDRVAPGSVLFELDSRDMQAELDIKIAELKGAEAEVSRWEQMPREEELPPLRSAVEAAESLVRQTKDVFDRRQNLLKQGATTEEAYIQARESYDAAVAQLKLARAKEDLMKAGAWKADLAVARAKAENQRAEVERFKTELERRIVRAPADMAESAGELIEWEVLQVNIRPGEYVSTPPVEPLIVLGDTGSRRIRVDIDEHDLSRFQPDTTAVAFARGNGKISYQLKFVRVDPYVIPKQSLTGGSAERVDTRVLQVLYEFQDSPQDIYVGQQMDVFIDSVPSGTSEQFSAGPGHAQEKSAPDSSSSDG